MNYLITAICLAGCFPLMFIYLRQYGTLLAPAALFTGIWLFTIGMFSLDLVRYIPIDVTTWAMLAGSGLCFLLGCLAAHLFLGGNRVEPGPSPGFDAEERRILWTLAITVPLGLVGVAVYVVLMGRMVGYDTFITRPYVIRDLQGSDAFRNAFRWPRFLNYLNILNVAIGSYYLARYWRRGAAKLVVGAVIIGFATTLVAMDRTLPFSAITWGFFTAEFARTEGRGARRTMARLGVVAAVAVVLFLGIAELLGKTLDNNRDAASYVNVSAQYQPLMMPYIYMTANIPSFQEFVRHTEGGSTHGIFLFLPAAKIIQVTVAPNVRIPEEVGDYYSVPFFFNTHTWLDVLWSDFGYIGLLFVPALLGAGSTLLFMRTCQRPNFRTCTLCGLACYIALNTIFVNKLVSTPLWEYTFLILAISWGLAPPPEAIEPLQETAEPA